MITTDDLDTFADELRPIVQIGGFVSMKVVKAVVNSMQRASLKQKTQ